MILYDILSYKDIVISTKNAFHKVLEDAPYMLKIKGELPESGDLELIDRCSIEMYTDSGKIYMTWIAEETVCDYNKGFLTIFILQKVVSKKL